MRIVTASMPVAAVRGPAGDGAGRREGRTVGVIDYVAPEAAAEP